MFTIAVSWPWGGELRAWTDDHGSRDVNVVLVRDRFGALDDGVDVVCLASGPAWIDQSLVSLLRTSGTTVVGVFESPGENAMWESWGVEHRISAQLAPADQLSLLERLRRPTTSAATADQFLDPPCDDDSVVGLPLVFGGAPGSGAREVALSFAARLTPRRPTVVIDANESGGGVAQRLGCADTPNVLDAVDVISSGGDLRRATATTILGNPVAFDVIAGLPADVAWTQWSSADAATLIDSARAQWNSVVVVTSPIIEDLRRWGDRYGVSRTLLSSPDSAVVAVVEASPRGVIRAAEWFAQARPVGRVPVVINKVPPRSHHVEAQVRERLLSIVGEDRVDIVASLPFDRAVQTAEWNAALPNKCRFARSVKSMAAALSAATHEGRVPAWQA